MTFRKVAPCGNTEQNRAKAGLITTYYTLFYLLIVCVVVVILGGF